MIEWTDDRVALLSKLWVADERTATQCARELGVTRNAVIGKVFRLGLTKRHNIAAKKLKGPGKFVGLVKAARKARSANRVPPKPARIKLPPPDVFAPAADAVPHAAWEALPGTVPVTLEALSRTGCRWPIGDDAPFMFCGCEALAGSSYCPTHRHRATGKGTTEGRGATRSLAVLSRLEVKNGFRSRQAGQDDL